MPSFENKMTSCGIKNIFISFSIITSKSIHFKQYLLVQTSNNASIYHQSNKKKKIKNMPPIPEL